MPLQIRCSSRFRKARLLMFLPLPIRATMDKAVAAKVVDPATRKDFALNDLVLIVPAGSKKLAAWKTPRPSKSPSATPILCRWVATPRIR